MMDLASTRDGGPSSCRIYIPADRSALVSRVSTELAVFELNNDEVVVRRLFGVDLAKLQSLVDIPLVDGACRPSCT